MSLGNLRAVFMLFTQFSNFLLFSSIKDLVYSLWQPDNEKQVQLCNISF